MKRILVMNFFPAFIPPASGGELRYFHLYSRLSKHFDVTLLSATYSQNSEELVTHSPHFREYRIPKHPCHDHLHMEVAKENIAKEFSALICALATCYPSKYHEVYCDIQANADIIIHDFPYMLDYDLLAGIDSRPRLYNSQNVESDLLSQLWQGPSAGKYLAIISKLEERLFSYSDACFTVSDNEADRFAEKYSLPRSFFTMVENGITENEFPNRELKNKSHLTALFFGSLHEPNIEAAKYIYSELAPMFPNITFLIAGNCLAASTANLPSNVMTLGRVTNEERLELFASADIALNPMFSGAGTNLKALEYMASGMPMLSTPLGARGLEIENQQHALIAERNGFSDELRRMIDNFELRKRLASSARAHVVKRFSWDAIAQRAASAIHALFDAHRTRKRSHILVLNDFSVAKPTSGGEVRINKLYTALAQYYDITLVCFSQDEFLCRTEIAPGFTEIQIPKTAEHKASENRYNWHISVADIVNYQQAPTNTLLVSLVKAIAKYVDIAVLCHPYMVGLAKHLGNLRVIYESLNVETELKRALLVGHPAYESMVCAVTECERLAIEISQELISVSSDDLETFENKGATKHQMHLVPNGVDMPLTKPDFWELEINQVAFERTPVPGFCR